MWYHRKAYESSRMKLALTAYFHSDITSGIFQCFFSCVHDVLWDSMQSSICSNSSAQASYMYTHAGTYSLVCIWLRYARSHWFLMGPVKHEDADAAVPEFPVWYVWPAFMNTHMNETNAQKWIHHEHLTREQDWANNSRDAVGLLTSFNEFDDRLNGTNQHHQAAKCDAGVTHNLRPVQGLFRWQS